MTLLVGSIFHMTRKIVSEMTYNVSMGTLNPTILLLLLPVQKKTRDRSGPELGTGPVLTLMILLEQIKI